MKPEDAEALGIFVADMIHAANAVGIDTERAFAMRIDALKLHFSGKPGSGACICPRSPESLKRDCDAWHETLDATKACIQVDHRCPWHGEKAQPKLWGRHKDKVLVVTGREWLSLGVEYPQS